MKSEKLLSEKVNLNKSENEKNEKNLKVKMWAKVKKYKSVKVSKGKSGTVKMKKWESEKLNSLKIKRKKSKN